MDSTPLKFGLIFADLYSSDGLSRLDDIFVNFLHENFPKLSAELSHARNHSAESELLIKLAPIVEAFISKLFDIEDENTKLQNSHHNYAVVAECKRIFVQRRALKKYKEVPDIDIDKVRNIIFDGVTYNAVHKAELTFAQKTMGWIESNSEEKLDAAEKYAAWAYHSTEGSNIHKYGTLFKTPKKLEFDNLVAAETINGELQVSKDHIRQRYGFKKTEIPTDLENALSDAYYCIYCHKQNKDSCRHGLKDKEGNFKESPTKVTLAGCPLEEKISEMNLLKSQGFSIASLATACIDNPMVAATGHRICNDCMKSCIYQKQEPVNIPKVETKTLRDVLELPYGFEIYSLLTRWNPLNFSHYLPKQESGYKILVVGMGPAGFTLAHYLLNQGHTVVAIDGLKIEPLPSSLYSAPIKDINTIFEELDERVLAGFGGVTEYGITVRWDKNFLKVIRLLLERRKLFQLHGGVRFGSNITKQQAFDLGFDHIALCMGAGKPTILNIPNSFARGVRAASDFLMALQLTGAAKSNSISNLQIRLPIIVIGGGLTAIDTATESLAYYAVQVEKFLSRHEMLGKPELDLNEEEKEIADEFITHAQAIREERKKPSPDIIALLQSWGGAKLLYRKTLQQSPSYRLNHEEIEKALEEGIKFIENMTPTRIEIDQYGHVNAIKVEHSITKQEILFPARTILVAAGTSPNTVIKREFPDEFDLDGKYFSAVDETGKKQTPEQSTKPAIPYVLTSAIPGESVSFFGDLHPSFAGNVVKAMASAKLGYKIIDNILGKTTPKQAGNFLSIISDALTARVHKVERLTDNIIEVITKAPLAAKNFRPGQFYRLQNYEANAHRANGIVFAMEGLAMTGAWVDKERGLISTIILEMGGSSSLCHLLKPGEEIVFMGPTGQPTEIKPNETVMLVGGGLGNAVLFSIGQALRETGSKVLYFAGYKKAQDRFKIEEIEKAADIVVWSYDETPNPSTHLQNNSFHGNIIDSIINYARNDPQLPLREVDRIIVIGSDRMMDAVNKARKGILKEYFHTHPKAIASINSPMQCMMKEICAQCLQKHIDPITKEESYVFSCTDQDQCMNSIDFSHLNERLKQNSVQEKLTKKIIALTHF
jgi:NADPH-dependent glutamate synthase beta subunit-like oxidoreductase/NAD(P)H-flavin reductase